MRVRTTGAFCTVALSNVGSSIPLAACSPTLQGGVGSVALIARKEKGRAFGSPFCALGRIASTRGYSSFEDSPPKNASSIWPTVMEGLSSSRRTSESVIANARASATASSIWL